MEIAEGTIAANNARRDRAETNRNYKWDGINYFVEYTSRNLKKIVPKVSLPSMAGGVGGDGGLLLSPTRKQARHSIH